MCDSTVASAAARSVRAASSEMPSVKVTMCGSGPAADGSVDVGSVVVDSVVVGSVVAGSVDAGSVDVGSVVVVPVVGGASVVVGGGSVVRRRRAGGEQRERPLLGERGRGQQSDDEDGEQCERRKIRPSYVHAAAGLAPGRLGLLHAQAPSIAAIPRYPTGATAMELRGSAVSPKPDLPRPAQKTRFRNNTVTPI